MKTLCILTAYNEIEYLPYKKNFCDHHNLDLYVIDNCSDDGTWEWLQDNKIPSHRFDTNDMFDLLALQKEILRTLHSLEEKPDWVIYNGVDLFPIVLPNLNEELARIDKEGFNLASIKCVGMFNTGEDRSKDPFNTFFYCSSNPGAHRPLTMIHKYHPSISYNADDVKFSSLSNKSTLLNGIMINYGLSKSFEEREVTYLRRKKAWDAGINPHCWGHHYNQGHNKKWIWDKNTLTDIRSTEYAEHVKHLQNICL